MNIVFRGERHIMNIVFRGDILTEHSLEGRVIRT